MFGKNKKTLALFTAIVLTFIGGRVGLAKGVSASNLSQTDQAYVIQIMHTWEEQTSTRLERHTRLSHGTAIGPHTILTHNHFFWPTGAISKETMTFVNADGQAVTLTPDFFALEPIDAGTLLVHLPNTVTLSPTPLATQSSVKQLGFGDWLTVHYWDDNANFHTKQDFMILYVNDGVATLFDPERLINSGDSGSGAYFEGRMAGNVWAIHTMLDGTATGVFNVALLPTQFPDWLGLNNNQVPDGLQ